VSSGGTADVQFGGQMSASTVESGGHELVSSGGAISGATLSGGMLEIGSLGTAGTSTITFDTGGTLKLDAPLNDFNYDMLVAGFNSPQDVIDFTTVSFTHATVSFAEAEGSTSSGTLTLSDGQHVVSVLLFGNYSAASFTPKKESGGAGTLVVDPPATDTSPIGLAPQRRLS
jgi:autotransporter passenger strand-loop-strand repeat protein